MGHTFSVIDIVNICGASASCFVTGLFGSWFRDNYDAIFYFGDKISSKTSTTDTNVSVFNSSLSKSGSVSILSTGYIISFYLFSDIYLAEFNFDDLFAGETKDVFER